jgi:hypothetical protein
MGLLAVRDLPKHPIWRGAVAIDAEPISAMRVYKAGVTFRTRSGQFSAHASPAKDNRQQVGAKFASISHQGHDDGRTTIDYPTPRRI